MSQHFFLWLLVALLGATFGSFATVLTDRIPKGVSLVKPRSMCPQCQKSLAVTDNIPLLGYVILRGRCRNCKQKISLQYPIIEAITLFLFLIAYLLYKNSIPTFALFVLATVTMPLVLIDARYRRLPNVLTISGIFLGVTFSIAESVHKQTWSPIWHSVLYSSLSFVFFLILNLISRGGMGFGDVKLAAMVGSLLFFLTWQKYVALYYFAFGLGSLYGIALMVIKRGNRKTMIPFGPFIIIGAWLAVCLKFFEL